VKKLLLIGGGHSHAETMWGSGLRSAADVCVTVVTAETGALPVDEVLPEQPSRTSAFFVSDLTGDGLRTRAILPILAQTTGRACP